MTVSVSVSCLWSFLPTIMRSADFPSLIPPHHQLGLPSLVALQELQFSHSALLPFCCVCIEFEHFGPDLVDDLVVLFTCNDSHLFGEMYNWFEMMFWFSLDVDLWVISDGEDSCGNSFGTS